MERSLVSRVRSAVVHQWMLIAVIITAGLLLAAAAALSSHSSYAAGTSVLMVSGSADDTSVETSTSVKPLLSTDLPSLATGPTVLRRVRDDLGEKVPVEAMRDRVKAKVNSPSTIMQVEYTAKTADKAIAGANALGSEITRLYRELATTRFDSLISDFKTQLTARRAELARLDGDLADISKTYPYIDARGAGSGDYGSGSVYQRLISLRVERDELQATLRADVAAAVATRQLIRNARPPAMRDIEQSDATYTRIREQFAKDSSELQRLSAYGSNRYPGLVELRRTVAREAQEVDLARRAAERAGPTSNAVYAQALDAQTKANGLVQSDRARVAAQNAALEVLHAQIGRSSIATTVARMRRDHDNAEAAYAIIASRLAKAIADRSEAASTGSVVVLERAQFASKSSIGTGTIAAFALVFLSVWLALTIAVMVDSSQDWFRDTTTIETVYGAPVIGSIV